ncbi:MAG: uroporphyrinogen decarboxylase family protein [Candidatus Rokuibacteriota bacterium]
MTKRERVLAALARQPVDRPPVSFWRHVPEIDHDAHRLAEAMLAFHERWDLDFIKVMSSGVYCVEDWGCQVAYLGSPGGAKQCTRHAVNSIDDWAAIKPLDPETGALGRELEVVRRIAAGRRDDAPILHTIFSPLTIARKLAGERVNDDLRAHPDTVGPALEAITRTVERYAAAALDAGADGLFVATQAATPEAFTEAESSRFDTPGLRRILQRVGPRSVFTLLHVHGKDIYFDQLATLPAHAINWHERVTRPSLSEAKRRVAGAVAGGLAEWSTLRRGSAAAITAEVEDAIRQTDGVGLIVAPGCVLPLEVPDENLAAVVAAVSSR